MNVAELKQIIFKGVSQPPIRNDTTQHKWRDTNDMTQDPVNVWVGPKVYFGKVYFGKVYFGPTHTSLYFFVTVLIWVKCDHVTSQRCSAGSVSRLKEGGLEVPAWILSLEQHAGGEEVPAEGQNVCL